MPYSGTIARFGTKAARRARRDWRRSRSHSAFTKFHYKNCVEKKYHDDVQGNAANLNTGTVYSVLSGIAQDSTPTGRIGTKAYLWNLHLNFIMDKDDDSGSCEIVRVMLVVDQQARGATPTIAEMLESVDVMSHRNLENSARFRFLYDRTIKMNPQGISLSTVDAVNSVGGCVNRQIAHRWPSGLHVTYDTTDTTGVSANIKMNNIWLVFLSTASNASVHKYNCRIRYTD